MSMVGTYNTATNEMQPLKLEVDAQLGVKNEQSAYRPSEKESTILQMIKRHFTLGYTNMYTPRVEFSDLSVIGRTMVDQMAFNTYQPNNGDGYPGAVTSSWRSNAVRPIVRNKVISIAAHATARLIFPKIFAWNTQSESQTDAAQVMEDLMEWSGNESNYPLTSLYATLSALVNPASIVYTEYAERYRTVKREKTGEDTYKEEKIVDETLSGFKDIVVSPDELFIDNFFEPDVQKQSWIIYRRVVNFSLLDGMFNKNPNWRYVKPGIQVFYNDANPSFYQVYDPNMRPYMAEWIIYWNREMDLKIDVVNGVMLSPYNNPNPRNDKQYPFAKFGYEAINNRCFYYKSLAFKTSHDANIINTLYPMIVDGTYLNLMPPMIANSTEIIGSDVIVPGMTTTFRNSDSKLDAIKVATDIRSGMDTLFKVEESINQSSEMPVVPDNQNNVTAYQIAKSEQERNTVLGLFVQMISDFVKQYGKLRLSDILQYMTIADVTAISDNPDLIYKTFFLHNKKVGNERKTRKIVFDSQMTEKALTPKEKMDESFKTLKQQGGTDSEEVLARVNPQLFRELRYMCLVSPDVLNPMSEDVERAYNLEVYDRAIANPVANQQAVFELLLQSTPTTRKDPHKFIQQEQLGQSPLDMAKQAMSLQGQGAPQPMQMPQQQPMPAMAGNQ